MYKLSEVKKKKTITIESLVNKEHEEELEILGFVPGTKATIISESIFSGPITVMLRGARVAIRKFEAEQILVV
jgi:Fe2+ transport system protein FeoA